MVLSKANLIDGKGEVEGYYFKDSTINFIGYEIAEAKEINPSTLKHSFNNGTTWHTEDEIKEALEAKGKLRYKCDECGIETDGSNLLCESCKKEYDE